VNTTDSANYGYADSPLRLEHLLIIARKRSLLSTAVRKKVGRQQDCHYLGQARLFVRDLPMHCRDARIRSSRHNLTMSAIIVVKSSKSPKVL
jgi:hypothetical protein